MCCGEAGEKEKERARGTSSTARFLFFSSTEYIFIGITIHWGGDRLVLQRTGRAGSKDAVSYFQSRSGENHM